MAKVRGQDIDPKGNYEASASWGAGVFVLSKIEPLEGANDDFVRVRLPRGLMRRIGRLKAPSENLSQATERLLLKSLENSKILD